MGSCYLPVMVVLLLTESSNPVSLWPYPFIFLAQKIDLIKTLIFCATSNINTRPKDKANEVKHVYDALRKDGYPQWLLKQN